MTLGLSVAWLRTSHLHSLKIVVRLKINLFLFESVRELINSWDAKIPWKRFGGIRVSFILDLNFVNLLLCQIYFCIITKLISNNFNAFLFTPGAFCRTENLAKALSSSWPFHNSSAAVNITEHTCILVALIPLNITLFLVTRLIMIILIIINGLNS